MTTADALAVDQLTDLKDNRTEPTTSLAASSSRTPHRHVRPHRWYGMRQAGRQAGTNHTDQARTMHEKPAQLYTGWAVRIAGMIRGVM